MDAAIFQAQVKQIEKLLFRIAWSYLGNNQDVEDAVQDALIKAWEKQKTLRNPQHFNAWIARILVNQCKNTLRKRAKWSLFPLDEKTPSVFSPEETPVLEAVHRLKPEQRIVVTLFYLDGYSQQDIAKALHCPLSTVKARLYSARKQLKKILLVEWEEQI